MPIEKLSGFKRTAHAEDGKSLEEVKMSGGKSLVQAPEHNFLSKDRHRYGLVAANPAIAEGVLDDTNPFYFDIDRNHRGQMVDPSFIFNITASAAARVVPVAYWFTHIEVKTLEGDTLIRYTPDALYQLQQASHKTSYMYDRYAQSRSGVYCQQEENAPAAAKNFVLDLPYSIFSHWPEYYPAKCGKLQVWFYPTGDINHTDSATFTLNSLKLQVDGPALIDMGPRDVMNRVRGKVFKHNFLDPQELKLTSQTLTVGQTLQVNLEQFKGFCAFMVLGIRASAATAAGAMMEFDKLGDTATLDIVDNNDKTLISKGQAIPIEHIVREYNPQLWPNKEFCNYSNLYVLPFAKDIPEALNGIMNGGLHLGGEDAWLNIAPVVGLTEEIQTITQDVKMTEGTYSFTWRGETSPTLEHDSAIGAMKIAFEAMKTVRDDGIEVTFEGTAAAAATFTCEIKRRDGGTYFNPEQHLVGLNISQIGATDASVWEGTAISTHPVHGSVASGTNDKDVRVWAYMYREQRTAEDQVQSRIVGQY